MTTIRQCVAFCCGSLSFILHNPLGKSKLLDFTIRQLPNPLLGSPAHFFRMTFVVEEYEAFYSLDVSFFGATTEVPGANGLPLPL